MSTIQDTLKSARHKLINSSYVTPLLGTDIGQDATGGAFSDGWVFLGHDDQNLPERQPSNTGKATVVLSMRNPWASPNLHNTARFRLMYVSIMADMTRASDTRLTSVKDAEDRCDRIAQAVTRVFHLPGNNDHWWPNNVYVISSLLYTDLHIYDVKDQDGLVVGDLNFALELD